MLHDLSVIEKVQSLQYYKIKTMLPSHRQIRVFFLLASFLSILNLAALFVIPHELDNSLIFGYSAPRIAFIFIVLLITSILIVITINLWMNTSVGKNAVDFIQNWLQDGLHVRLILGVVLLGIAIGTFLLIELIFTDNLFLKGILIRLSPFIGFVTISFAYLNYLLTNISKEQDLSKKLTSQMYYLVLAWIILNLFWFLGTVRSLEDILIFKRVVILCVSVYIYILFSLDYFLTSDRLTRWLLAFSLILATSLSLWITNRFNEMSEYTILTLMLSSTFIFQLMFLGTTIFRDKVKQNLIIGNSIINIKAITIFLSSFAAILASIALFLQISAAMEFGKSFNNFGNTFTLDSEMNVPATFSSIILLIAAGLLFFVFISRLKKKGPFTWHWGFLSIIFVFLSYDEMFSLHESIIGPLRNYVKVGGIFSYEWIILAIPLMFILAITYSRFLFHLPLNIRFLIFLAAGLFLGGSIGGEMMSGWYASKFGEGDANYILLTIFEETLEMSGIIIFIHAILLLLFYESLVKLQKDPTTSRERIINKVT